jgi:hypothetical protein
MVFTEGKKLLVTGSFKEEFDANTKIYRNRIPAVTFE